MKKNIEEYIAGLSGDCLSDDKLFADLLRKLDFRMDTDYISFIKTKNGAEGLIGNNSYVLLWNIEELIDLNPYYEGGVDCKELFFFGSDGSNFGYAFDKKSGEIVGIDFLNISNEQPQIIANSFELFLQTLSNK